MADIRDVIFDDVYTAFSSQDKHTQRQHLGKAIHRMMRLMDERWQKRFVEVWSNEEPEPDALPRVFLDINDPDLEYIAHWWKRVSASIPSDDKALKGVDINFKKCIRTGKTPSPNVQAIVKRYFSDWRATRNADGPLMEDE
ncbi:hypothetical protein ROJ8625_04110 [Roseivivax jejudonensis]|uniref:Uncharacterized protein n=1 Tax=Roseivivax jejudonensis TaxID=1529041 RepID=A0A1X7AAY6_9RHOB|nr:hypothetical protein [Roseivivax jejudonensis]SLN74836.1 hypothetical protein ROJ8625_04110 [Roseivivax jejudonensis]